MIYEYTMNEEEIAYTKKMARDLYSKSSTNKNNESLNHKIKQTIKGNLIEFNTLKILKTSKHSNDSRYRYDLIVEESDVQRVFGYTKGTKNNLVTIEVKNHKRNNDDQKFFTFHENRFHHLRKNISVIDYALIGEVTDLNINIFSGKIEYLGIFDARVFASSDYIQKSYYSDKYFLKDYCISRDGMGKIFWNA